MGAQRPGNQKASVTDRPYDPTLVEQVILHRKWISWKRCRRPTGSSAKECAQQRKFRGQAGQSATAKEGDLETHLGARTGRNPPPMAAVPEGVDDAISAVANRSQLRLLDQILLLVCGCLVVVVRGSGFALNY